MKPKPAPPKYHEPASFPVRLSPVDCANIWQVFFHYIIESEKARSSDDHARLERAFNEFQRVVGTIPQHQEREKDQNAP